jgi:hypothetical protein
VALHDAPLRISQYHNNNCAALQVLLRRYVFVGRQGHFKSGFLGGFQQFPIDELVPTGILRFGDSVAFKKGNERRGP